MRDVIKTGIAKVYIDQGIIVVKIVDKSDIDKKDIEEGNSVVEKLTSGRKYYSRLDVRDINLGHITMKAFQYHATNELNKNKCAEAIVLNSVGIRLLASFYIKTFRPKVPTKIFTDYAEAKNWLEEIKKQNILLNN